MTDSNLDAPLPDPFRPDLEAYFQRIGDHGSRGVTLATLHRIAEAHVRSIPFENIDVLMGKRISVAPADIERKLVHGGRGGYCFEQNTYLYHVLAALGFEAMLISARVRINKPRDIVPSRTHVFLRVELDGASWLVDVGVGGASLTCAIRLELDEVQETPHDKRRLTSSGAWSGFAQRSPDAVLFHEVLLGDTWETIADFTLEEMHPIDLELGNWYTNMHPQSHFRDQLSVARSTEVGRLTLRGREFKRRDMNGATTTQQLGSSADVLTCLRQEFGIAVPDDALAFL